jgi:hypothetical protein
MATGIEDAVGGSPYCGLVDRAHFEVEVNA